MGKLIDNTLESIKRKRQRILDGGLDCIPSPFERFSDDFVGIEQSTYYVVTSLTKGSKTQFTSYVFIYRPILYAYYHPEKNLKVKVLYFPLEETPERITQRFMSYVYYMRTGKRKSPKELRSTQTALDQEVIDFFELPENKRLLEFYESCIQFYDSTNPTGIYKDCRQYAEEHGTTHYLKIKKKDEFGVEQDAEVFESYVPDDPDEYKLIIIDTINLIDTERGMDKRQSINKLSEYLAKYLRNRYGFSPVVIQQQSADSENNEAFKLGRIRPTTYALGDSKYTSHDANVVLGLFAPFRFGLTDCFDYDIKKLRDNIRFCEVLTNRDGDLGGMIPLFFDGAVCDFRELPPPTDTQALDNIYRYLHSIRQ